MRATVPRFLAFLAAASLSTIAARAGADLVAPRQGAETCTVQKQGKPGSECLQCSAFFGNPEHCSASLASYGFTSACRTGGASSWSEVWCRAATPSAAKVPPEVLGQLDKPSTGLRPAASSAPVTTGAPATTAAPVPPPALPASPLQPTSVPADTTAPAPPPVPPPPSGCACTVSGAESSLPALVLALSAAAAAISRRRRR